MSYLTCLLLCSGLLFAACQPDAEQAARVIAQKECDCFQQREQQLDATSCQRELDKLYADFEENYRFTAADSARMDTIRKELRQSIMDCGVRD